MMMTTGCPLGVDGPSPTVVSLRTVVTCTAMAGPGFEFDVAFIMPQGTVAGYDPEPVIGEPFDGVYTWYRLLKQDAFVHSAFLRPA